MLTVAPIRTFSQVSAHEFDLFLVFLLSPSSVFACLLCSPCLRHLPPWRTLDTGPYFESPLPGVLLFLRPFHEAAMHFACTSKWCKHSPLVVLLERGRWGKGPQVLCSLAPVLCAVRRCCRCHTHTHARTPYPTLHHTTRHRTHPPPYNTAAFTSETPQTVPPRQLLVDPDLWSSTPVYLNQAVS